MSGIIQIKGIDYCVVDVNGVGFRVNTSINTIANLEQGQRATVYTYLNVKEDELSLYGFASYEELNTFLMMISVSGVGPKMALAILSSMSPSDFCISVSSGNHKALCKTKGVGPKLAQRIVLELKDKVKKEIAFNPSEKGDIIDELSSDVLSEAAEALMVLGYSSQQANAAVKKVYKEGMLLEDMVKAALKNSI
ncbi:MAG: Holliday junction branch migration protein RuvA [Clostridia bacterium]|nr:Holliday junction branch migration protein RuvA [Clostridia bacterium]